jgi:hypothetical protein
MRMMRWSNVLPVRIDENNVTRPASPAPLKPKSTPPSGMSISAALGSVVG